MRKRTERLCVLVVGFLLGLLISVKSRHCPNMGTTADIWAEHA